MPVSIFSAFRLIIIMLISLFVFGALFFAVYDLWHPNADMGVVAAIITISACSTAFVFLKIRPAEFKLSNFASISVIFITGMIFRIITIISIPNEQISDFKTFHELAVAINNGEGFAYTGPEGYNEARWFLHRYETTNEPMHTAFRLPGTPLLLSAVYKISGQRQTPAKLLNALFGASIGPCLFLLLCGYNRKIAFATAILSEIYPPGLFYTNLLGTEIHFTFGIILAALIIDRTIKSQNRSSALSGLLAGMVTGFTCLIRPATQFILCVFAAILFSKAKYKKIIITIAVITIGVAVSLFPWGIRNYKMFGHFELQTTEMGLGWFTMTRDIIPEQYEHSLDSLTSKFMKSTDEFEIARIGKKIGTKRLLYAIKDISFIKTSAQNYQKTWKHDLDALNWCCTLPEYTGAYIKMPVSDIVFNALKIICEFFYITLLILAVFGAAESIKFKERISPGLMVLFFYFIFSAMLACIFQGQTRYHYPLMPMIFILAARSFGIFSQKETDNKLMSEKFGI